MNETERHPPIHTLSGAGLAAAAIGALVGFADGIRGLLAGGDEILPRHVPVIAAGCAALFAVAGILSAGFGFLLARRRPLAFARAAIGAFAFALLAGGILNRHVLTGSFASAPSLLVNGAVLAASVALFAVLSRRGGERVRPGRFLAIGAAFLLAALAVPLLLPDGPPAPKVRRAEGSPPSVLVLLVDALRPDHLSLYGYGTKTSPHLDAFAADAAVFETARAESTWTKTSVSTIFTGLPPLVHGNLRSWNKLPGGFPTLAECLRAGGYETAAFVQNAYLDPHFGLVRGFDRVEAPEASLDPARPWRASLLGNLLFTLGVPEPSWPCGSTARPLAPGADAAHRALLAWLDGRPAGRPWFACVHAMEPHWRSGPEALPTHRHRPWRRAPERSPEERQRLVDAYDARVSAWDRSFGELVAELSRRGRLEDTVVVVLADHGEEFGEHGGYGHAQSLHEEVLRVPLVVRGPRIGAARVRTPVSLRALFPTVLSLTGISLELEPVFPLAAPLLPPPAGGRDHVAYYDIDGVETMALVAGDLKWILSRRGGEESLQCYDLSADPAETRDLAAERPEESAAARARMVGIMELQKRVGAIASDVTPWKSMEEALRGLGYLR